MPMPDRIYAYNLLQLNSAEAMLTPEFLHVIDVETPLGLLRDAYVHASATGQLNRMLALDLQFTLADNDLYKVSSMCGLAGIDVAYPMLNDALVAFSTHLPEELKLKGRKLRYFFKEALRDFLPIDIINKRKHGFGLPIGVWMRSHPPLRDLAYDALDALAGRGVVQRSFITHLTEQHHADNAAYWGNEIWVLSQLELWLQAHGFPRGQALV
jgi:asparagine synthase (glutamine-hydrolysing)